MKFVASSPEKNIKIENNLQVNGEKLATLIDNTQQTPRGIMNSSLDSVNKKIIPVIATARLANSKSTERTQVLGDKSANIGSHITSEKSKRRIINLKELDCKQILPSGVMNSISQYDSID